MAFLYQRLVVDNLEELKSALVPWWCGTVPEEVQTDPTLTSNRIGLC